MPVETDPAQRTPDDATPPANGGHSGAGTPRRSLLPWIAGLVALAVVVVLAVVLFGGDDDAGDDGTAARAPSVEASVGALASLPGDVRHAVYWTGPRAGTTYELTRTRRGRVYIRYLPAGVPVGSDEAIHRTVGSYPQRDPLAALEANARAQGVATVALPDGGRAYQDARRPTSAYAAFPGSDVQVEVFDAVPGRALRLIRAGELVAIGARAGDVAGTVAPRIVTAEQLHDFAAGEDGPVYWAGARPDARYELTRTADGRVYVRYLAPGVEAGSRDSDQLTVGTYPQADALATLRATAARRGSGSFALPGGAIGAVLRASPDSVYLAYPGADMQIELFDPDGNARTLATEGAIVPVS